MAKLALLFTVALGGCYTSVVVNRGVRPYPPKPATCDLKFDYYDADTALALLADYLPVGTLELAWQPEKFEWSERTRDKLRPAACSLGGDVVAYAGFTVYGSDALGIATGGKRWGQFQVLRKR